MKIVITEQNNEIPPEKSTYKKCIDQRNSENQQNTLKYKYMTCNKSVWLDLKAKY